MEDPTRPEAPAPDRTVERRAPARLPYTVDQLLGRAPIWLRRREDKLRLVGHLVVAIALVALSAWWVVPRHAFSGPVLFTVATGRGVHVGDLLTVAFVPLAGRSLWAAGRILRRR